MGVTLNYERVHAAMTAVGKQLPEIERVRQIKLRAIGELPPLPDHVCICGTAATARFIQGWRCDRCAPMRVVRDRCVAPLRCYCRTHLGGVQLDTSAARSELAHVVDERTNALKHEIVRLAKSRQPFGLAQLAEHLPPARSSARADAERWVLDVLTLAVEKGVVAPCGDREWRGPR